VRDIELRAFAEDVDGEQGRFWVVLDEEDPAARYFRAGSTHAPNLPEQTSWRRCSAGAGQLRGSELTS
jgi:hypothetical protein